MKATGPDVPEDSKSSTGCLGKGIQVGLALFIILLIAAYTLPGFLAYQNQRRVDRTAYIAEGIRTALADYADNHPDYRYPDKIHNYAKLQILVNKHGGSLPVNQSDVNIDQIHYTSEDSKDYSSTITVDVPDNTPKGKYLTVTPEGVIRSREITK